MLKHPTKQSNKRDTESLLADADIAIIGGGVVGCAVARRMALEGASVVLIEKAGDILDGTDKEGDRKEIGCDGVLLRPVKVSGQCWLGGYTTARLMVRI
jgi:hypothetical protein